jgi:2-amino-4-hydroxy-6-hydroxymethyldihydropteridine diphosphokinase
MNAEKYKVVLLLGSNLGNRMLYINTALNRLDEEPGSKIVLKSSIYETAPWGFTDQPDYLNQVAVIETSLQPLELLQTLKKIEKELGRTASGKWKERTIDIDILFYDEIIFRSGDLIIPHPFLHKRKFTLVPLVEIMPDFVHPALKKKMTELLTDCLDTCNVNKTNFDFINN